MISAYNPWANGDVKRVVLVDGDSVWQIVADADRALAAETWLRDRGYVFGTWRGVRGWHFFMSEVSHG